MAAKVAPIWHHHKAEQLFEKAPSVGAPEIARLALSRILFVSLAEPRKLEVSLWPRRLTHW